jgi:hypothetical protein
VLLAILFVGTQVNSSLALFNLIPFGPFDGAKIFKWNRLVWLITAIIAMGFFIYIQSPQYSLEKINAPTQPSIFSVHSEPNGRYIFEYPSNWQKVDDVKNKFGEIAKQSRDLVIFAEEHDYAYFALVEYNLWDYYYGGYVSDSDFYELVGNNIRTNGLELSERTVTAISTMDGNKSIRAYSLCYLTKPNHTNIYIETYTHTKDSLFVFCFSCPVKYKQELSGVYEHFLASCKLK